jgi:tetratricopeptide (TPR) repeat protein
VDIYRRLAESRPDVFLPDLAMSLGALGTAYLTAEQYEAAAEAFAEGLALVTPFAERHPQAFGDLVRGLGQDYIQACEKAGWEPDAALLERAARALGVDGGGGDAAGAGAPPEIPDEAVRALISEPQLQKLLTAVLRQNNIEGAPGELPIEVQRALIAALVGQGMIKFGEAEGSEAAAAPRGETATDERGEP